MDTFGQYALTSVNTTSNSFALDTPVGTANGDLLVAIIFVDGSGDEVATPSGWSAASIAETTLANRYVFARAHDGSTPSWTFTRDVTGTGERILAALVAFAKATGIGVAINSTQGSSNSPFANSINCPTTGSLQLASFFCMASDAGANAPSGWTNILDLSASDAYLKIHLKDGTVSAGATGTVNPSTYSAIRNWVSNNMTITPPA